MNQDEEVIQVDEHCVAWKLRDYYYRWWETTGKKPTAIPITKLENDELIKRYEDVIKNLPSSHTVPSLLKRFAQYIRIPTQPEFMGADLYLDENAEAIRANLPPRQYTK